jgi:hypothetical protein
MSWFPNLLPGYVVIPNGALCREESAVLDSVPAAGKSRFLRFAFGMTRLAIPFRQSMD